MDICTVKVPIGTRTLHGTRDHFAKASDTAMGNTSLQMARRQLSQHNEHATFYSSDRYYKGEYKGGVKDGYGVFVYRDETRYEGTFECNVKEGQGIMYYSDGSKYVGDYHNGMMDGQGEYIWPNGVKYVGEWRSDERHGFGQMFFSDDEPAYRARWERDQRVFD